MSGAPQSAQGLGEPLFDSLSARPRDAVVLRGDSETWRAAELQAAIDSLACGLAGVRVLAVLADNGPAWVIADLAALRAGVVHLPLPGFFSPSQLAHALTQAGADTVLTDQPARIASLDLGFTVVGKANGLLRMARATSAAPLPPATTKISFTSGSTGAPRGVCLSAAGLLDTAVAVAGCFADLAIERHLAVLPLSLLLENSAGIHASLLLGAEIRVAGLQTLGWRGMAGFDPVALQRTVVASAANSLILVPELLKMWSAQRAAGEPAAANDLRYVAVGGARVAPELLARARAVGLPAYQGYGLTECGSVVSLNRPGDDAEGVGRPLPHVRVRIADGEVLVGGRAFLGYVGDEWPQPATAAKLPEFATGDLGRLDGNGHLHLDGRRKNLLITSFGRNVAPEWIESLLLAEPAIAQTIVCGDGMPGLCALLVAAPGAERGALSAAVARVNAGLPDYARIADWLPVAPFSVDNGLATGNGRPRRNAILQHHAADLAALFHPEREANDVLS
ncbi:MAG: AMP-binding protein [Accumulibacter sp.]|jgi:long-chain acyl-CoA synthetase